MLISLALVAGNKNCSEPINNILREFASSCTNLVGLIDLPRVLNHSDASLWKLDRVHFSKAGSDELGRLFYQNMLNFSHEKLLNGSLIDSSPNYFSDLTQIGNATTNSTKVTRKNYSIENHRNECHNLNEHSQ